MKRAWILGVSALLGCGNSASECTNATMGMEGQFVANAITVPMSSNDYSFDLNGDGHADNRLGNIIGALIMNNLDVQGGVNDSITKGSVLLLVDEKASDLTNNDCASVDVKKGNLPSGTTAPDFGGSGMFTIDTSFGAGTVKGKISGGKFTSNNPATASTDYSMSVQFPLVTGEAPLSLTIHGAHLQFTKSGTGLMNGQINGGIKAEDVQGQIIPTVASLLTHRLASGGSQNSTISSLFDTGGTDDGSGCVTKTDCGTTTPKGGASCKNPTTYPAGVASDVAARAGMCSDQCDNIIDVCEVSTNMLVKNLLAPDVQLFNNGAYGPSKDNKTKDSLSLGLGFTAVGAKF